MVLKYQIILVLISAEFQSHHFLKLSYLLSLMWENYLNFLYTLMSYKLAVITPEKDLSLTGESSIRTSAQYAMVVKETKETASYIRENI